MHDTAAHTPTHPPVAPPAATPLQDKVQAFWDITKRELADARVEARLKDRELEEEQVGAGRWGRCWSTDVKMLPAAGGCNKRVAAEGGGADGCC